MVRRILLLSVLFVTPLAPLAAQDTSQTSPSETSSATSSAASTDAAAEESNRDRSWLTALIEDKLSGQGRQIRLDGFKGAFSSKATFDTLTISDDQGAWLTIHNGTLSWSRTALLTGKVEISELSATEIDLDRLPDTPADTSAPAPEAKPFEFQLPDLPLSINIGKLHADKVALDATILGQSVTFGLDGSGSLAGGDGKAKIAMTRTDGVKGQYSFTGGFTAKSRQLDVDLLVDEGKGGLVSTLSKIPGAPALTLAASGGGPLDNFSSDIVLSTDAQPRVTGKVILKADKTADGQQAQGFSVALRGDISPMLPEEYHDFFGTDTNVEATGTKLPDGGLNLTKLALDTRALDLNGTLKLLPSGMPDNFNLRLKLGLPAETPAPEAPAPEALAAGAAKPAGKTPDQAKPPVANDVLLPITGASTWVHGADLKLYYDRSQSQGWTLSGTLDGLRRDDMTIASARLAGNGLVSLDTQTNAASGRVNFDVSGLALRDPALAEAAGDSFSGSTVFDWTQGHPVNLTNLVLQGRDLSLAGAVSVGNFSTGIDITPDVTLKADDLRHYALLSGRPLAGSLAGTLRGKVTALSGAFDIDAALTGQNLRTGIAEADGMLGGTSKITLSAARDAKGLTLRSFDAEARTVSATASGVLATGASDLKAELTLSDLATLGKGYRGHAHVTASILDRDGATQYALDGTASNLALGQPQADTLLRGATTLTARAESRDGKFRLTRLDAANPQLSAKVAEMTGPAAGTQQKLSVALKLANAALLAPGFAGPVTIDGTVGQNGASYGLDLKAAGPGGLQATVAGSVAGDLSKTDLAIKGRAEAALANNFIDPQSVNGIVNFDLKMQGAPGLPALSGRIETGNARFTAPSAGLALQNIVARADLGQGKVTLNAKAAMKGGGDLTLNGPVTLSAPYQGNLTLVLNRARLRDPELYDTRISGRLAIAGPLAGGASVKGRLSLGQTEIRVPNGLGGAAAIPDIHHVRPTTAVAQTLKRAGLSVNPTAARAARGSAAAYGLDITVDAPNQIFVRGRGLDAELGGSLRLTGTTANIVPIGHFALIRGRLDVLAKRLTLTDGQVAMQGSMTPWILFTATTTQDSTTININLEGEATSPQLKLSSSPDLPEDEILARLLFNKGLTNLSALQAAQLASAVATLAGKGGTGIVSKLRQDFGLDDLDLGTDDSGNTSVRAGKYLSKRVYSDVAVDSAGQTELNLNFDVRKNITARSTVASDGNSSVGLFFDKDY